MITKHYIAKGLTGVSLSLLIDGVCRRVEFRKGHRVGNVIRFASYSTTDKKEQEAIEALRFPIITLERVEGEEEPQSSEQESVSIEVSSFGEVKTTKEAIAVLTEKFGLKPSQCNTKAKILKKMAELNIEFPNIAYGD